MNRFPVDDVQASMEQLETEELLAFTRDNLRRGVLLGPHAGCRVVNSYVSCSNPIVAAVHLAFSRHLPLALSPDAIWLSLVQGFSHHVNENAETLRGRLVRHQGREKLVERIQKLTIGHVTAAVSGFSDQIRAATDPALHDTLLCDFSTTTPEARTASEIALMDTYSHYFEYELEMCVCGIPSITLAGTAQDWRRIRDRVEVLDTFGLEWWTTRLRPILDEFVHAAEGRPNREFWRGIYKFRPAKGLYDQQMVTGWLVDLFPYLGDAPVRRRNPALEQGGTREVAAGAFPSGLASVAVRLNLVNDDHDILATHDLELVAGLLGVEQAQDATLSPMISWCLARPAAPVRG